MIKKVLVFVVACSFSGFGQNKEVKERINDLQESIDGLEQIDNMYDLKLIIKPGDSEFDENDSYAFTKSVKPQESSQIITQLNQRFFYQDIIAPYSILRIQDSDSFDWIRMLGVDNFFFHDHPDYKPVFTLLKVYFLDGTSKTAKEILVPNQAEVLNDDKSSFNDEYFLINSTKFVTSIEYSVSMKGTQVETLKFSPDKTENVLNNQTIRVINWSGKEVGFQFPDNAFKELLGMDAVYKNGKFLNEKGSNSTTLPPKTKRKQLQNLSKFYAETIQLAKKNNFKTVKDLDDYIIKNHPEVDTITPNDVLKNFYFSGPPSEIHLYFPKEAKPSENEIVKNERFAGYGRIDKRVVAADFKTRKQGVMNLQGEWLVKPDYEYISNLNDYFFTAKKENENNGSYFWLSDDGKQWKNMYNIEPYRNEVYGDFVVVEKDVNGPKGIINIKTGEMVMPTIYNNIYVEENLFVVDNEEELILLDEKANKIISGNYKSIRINKPFIYLLPLNGNNFNGYQVFNYKGQNISTNFLSDGGYESGSDLVLVYKKGKGEYERNYFYLNTKGDVVITVDPAKYERAERFTNDRALWKTKDGMYGFVDTKGKTVIPFDYIDASEFRGKYALIKRKISDGNIWIGLIDEKGKPHTEFKQWPYYIGYSENDKTWIYNLDDKTVYDGEGNLIKRD